MSSIQEKFINFLNRDLKIWSLNLLNLSALI